ncbi:MAG: phosphate propanoyltransferase [Firmicutes bacterium]|nr:phosphate propanoyltransferase [Bacillota bacterium]HBG08748.1 propanediol utilization protein [Bacillota bacterium]
MLGEVPVGISNRHIHLSQEHLEVLFGPGYELTVKKDLSQTGQYAAEETLIIEGPKSSMKNVRILGPVRKETQVEISRTDAFGLGLKPPVRDSGFLEDSPGLKLIGPKGEVELDKGVIIAQRHIHMNEADAEAFGVKDKDIVSVRVGGERGLIFDNVLVRVRGDFVLEMHIDTDEANAAMLNNGQMVEVLRD